MIDNGSTDGSQQVLSDYKSKVEQFNIKIIKLQNNVGTTISRNYGIDYCIKETCCDYVCVLDSDTEINQNAIDKMVTVLEADQRNGIVGPVLEDEISVVQNSARKIPTVTLKVLKIMPMKWLREKGEALEKYDDDSEDIRFTGYLMSACWLIKSEVFNSIGYLDEKIFYAPEDVEFCLRAWTQGYRVLYCKTAKIVHTWQRISRKKLFSKHNFEHIKGLIYLFWKYKYLFSDKKFQKYFK